MTTENERTLIPTGEATAILPAGRVKPITVIGTEAIRATFDDQTLQQAIHSRLAPGVIDVVLNPDAHVGYGAPIGCVMVSPSHIYPGPVGVDIKCSMSLLQLNLPADAIQRAARPPGADQRHLRADPDRARHGAAERAEIPRGRCHAGPAGSGRRRVAGRVPCAGHSGRMGRAMRRLGPYGTRRHPRRLGRSGSTASWPPTPCRSSPRRSRNSAPTAAGTILASARSSRSPTTSGRANVARVFGLLDGHVAFLSHCGSRGLGYNLASGQFRALQQKFETWSIPLPGGDRELVYAPLGTPEADAYLDDMALGANFATVNHLLINALVLEAFQEVFPGVTGQLVYFISHNIARKEVVDEKLAWVHRKGATRAFPAGHHALKGTPFADTGHPILLPGNPQAGSVVMVADAGAVKSCYSVNHGAGRQLGRKEADPPTRSTDDRPPVRRGRHPDQLPAVSQGRSPGGIQGLRRSAAFGHRRRTGQRSGATAGEVRDQGREQGR